MSQLTITSLTQQFTMNVTGFSSPIYGSISSAQTRSMAMYFPTKMSQPDIQFDVQFTSVTDFAKFALFVRNHQQTALTTSTPALLNWPERNINNFSGFIQKFQAGGAKALYAPTARFTVSLVNSTVSTRTTVASIANPWNTVYGMGLIDGVLNQPSSANNSLVLNVAGESIVNAAGGVTSPLGAVVSGLFPGITTGS
jgi:hypothetical protein